MCFVRLFLCALERGGAWPSAAWLAPALPRCGAGTLAASGGAYQDLRGHGRFGKKTGDFVLVSPPRALLFWGRVHISLFSLGTGAVFI